MKIATQSIKPYHCIKNQPFYLFFKWVFLHQIQKVGTSGFPVCVAFLRSGEWPFFLGFTSRINTYMNELIIIVPLALNNLLKLKNITIQWKYQ